MPVRKTVRELIDSLAIKIDAGNGTVEDNDTLDHLARLSHLDAINAKVDEIKSDRSRLKRLAECGITGDFVDTNALVKKNRMLLNVIFQSNAALAVQMAEVQKTREWLGRAAETFAVAPDEVVT